MRKITAEQLIDLTATRRRVKLLMIDSRLDQRGGIKTISGWLGINQRSLTMALSGYRKGPNDLAMLQNVEKHLLATAQETDSARVG